MTSLKAQWQMAGSAAEAYERYAVRHLFRPLAERFLAEVPLRPGDSVLDLACGTGVLARLAAPRVAPTGRVVGIDLNEMMLAVARARSAEEGASILWKQGDAAALPFRDAQFEAVLCQQGLQFIADKPRALREMTRVTVPDGFVALAVFGEVNRYDAALAEGLDKYVGERIAKLSLGRFALSDPVELRSLVANAGLRSIEMRTIVLTRRVEPTQEWLLESTAGVPYGAEVAAMEATDRAAMMREIAGQLKDLWSGDYFAVPMDVHLVYAKKGD
jgi:ubiquinone/menaquinone biosynthesis C-methylase UbiE